MFKQFHAMRRGFAALLACAAVAVLAAACGSSGSGASSTTASGGSSSSASTASSSASSSGGSSAAAKLVTAAEQVPASIGITTPLAKKPPSGKTILFLQCDTAVCGGFLTGLRPAAAALGWKVKTLSFQQTPEGIQQAFTSAIQQKPSGIFASGTDMAIIKQQLSQASAANIPVVIADVPDTPSGAVKAIIQGAASSEAGAKLPADWIAANGGGDTLTVDIPTYPVLVEGTQAFTAELTKQCPSCQVTNLNQQVTAVGTSLPAAVVSELQAHPNIKNVAFAFGDMTLGVPQALKAAGITVNIVQYGASSPSEVTSTAQGQLQASLSWSIPYSSWRGIDAFARYFEGESAATDTSSTFPLQLLTKSNAAAQVPHPASSFEFSGPANYPEQFKKLWKVG